MTVAPVESPVESHLIQHFGLSIFDSKNIKLDFLPNKIIKNIEYHRGLEEFDVTKKEMYYLYTGRGPSHSSFHIGHLVGLNTIIEFQKIIGGRIYFMISDDEKIMRDNISLNEMQHNVNTTIQQLEQCGFTDENTQFHINTNGINETEYKIIITLMSKITLNELNNIFGEKKTIGEYFYVFYQLMPCFLDKNKQCVVIAGVDQDPFFRLARDLAERLHYKKPIIIYVKNVFGLDGSKKMSTSEPNTIPIFLNDSKETIMKKVMSIKKVGAGTLEELFLKGANIENDIPFQLIKIFETDEEKINLLKLYYTSPTDETNENIQKILKLVCVKGTKIKNKQIMITSYGMRLYLVNLLTRILEK